MRTLVLLPVLLSLLLTASCAHQSQPAPCDGRPRVARLPRPPAEPLRAREHSAVVVSSDRVIDLSGHWNDVDSNQSAKALVAKLRPWCRQHKAATGALPLIQIYPFRNRSMEVINGRALASLIEVALTEEGLAEFTPRGSMERPSRPHFVLNGYFTAAIRRLPASPQMAKLLRIYAVSLELVDSAKRETAWRHEHKIVKLVTRRICKPKRPTPRAAAACSCLVARVEAPNL